MPNINLNLADENARSNSSGGAGASIIISAVILGLILVLYGALILMNKNLTSKISIAEGQYKTEYNKFVDGNANIVIDFKNRGVVAGDLIKKDKLTSDMLKSVEDSILPAVHLDSLKYDKEKGIITLACVGDNFNTVAKQILSFKESGRFQEVIPGPSLVNSQKNELDFSIDLKIK